MENDGFNQLVLTAGLSAREIMVLRAYCKFIRQAGSSFSQAYMEEAMAAHADIARSLVRLFETQFDPARQQADSEKWPSPRRLISKSSRRVSHPLLAGYRVQRRREAADGYRRA